jgi:hypothetical protein
VTRRCIGKEVRDQRLEIEARSRRISHGDAYWHFGTQEFGMLYESSGSAAEVKNVFEVGWGVDRKLNMTGTDHATWWSPGDF